MRQPVIKPQPIHWWLLAAAILFGIALFFYLRIQVY